MSYRTNRKTKKPFPVDAPSIHIPSNASAYEIMEIIRDGDYTMNGYAKTYYNAFPQAETDGRMMGLGGKYGLQMQIPYFYSNVKCKTPKQKAIKKALIAWSRTR